VFRASLAHLQEALHKQHWVNCVRIMSVGCGTVTVTYDSQLTFYARNTQNAVCEATPEDEQVMFETCISL
jgi:hypothetical protein